MNFEEAKYDMEVLITSTKSKHYGEIGTIRSIDYTNNTATVEIIIDDIISKNITLRLNSLKPVTIRSGDAVVINNHKSKFYGMEAVVDKVNYAKNKALVIFNGELPMVWFKIDNLSKKSTSACDFKRSDSLKVACNTEHTPCEGVAVEQLIKSCILFADCNYKTNATYTILKNGKAIYRQATIK